MPRQPIDNNVDPENIYSLESAEEIDNFINSYTSSSIYERYPESDYDYDSDNYGYYDDYSY